jgi:hypothetical protein
MEVQPNVERTALIVAEFPLVERHAEIRARAGGGGRIDRFRHSPSNQQEHTQT